MFKRLGHIALIFALLAATGSHWVIFQSVAWTNMLANNLSTLPFQQAVVKTFDGQHPCCLCKEITRGKQSEKKAEFSVDLKKLEFCQSLARFEFVPPAYFWNTVPLPQTLRPLAEPPPTPPPRLA